MSVSLASVIARENAGVFNVNVKNVTVRYANSGDIPGLQAVAPFVVWEEFLYNKYYGIIVIDYKNSISGCYVFHLSKTTYFVSNFIISEKLRHQKLGTRLIEDLKDRCYKTQHKLLSVKVPEFAVDLQLFLKKSGFIALKSSNNGTWYNMIYRV